MKKNVTCIKCSFNIIKLGKSPPQTHLWICTCIICYCIIRCDKIHFESIWCTCSGIKLTYYFISSCVHDFKNVFMSLGFHFTIVPPLL